MDIRTEERNDITVFYISGEVNLSSSPSLRKYFEKVVSNKIIINFDKVQYIDSSGLATLVEVLKRVKTKGGKLGLAHLSDKVRSLFEITKLDKIFGIYSTEEEAVNQLR